MKMITRREAAQMLGVTEQSISNYVNKGILPSVKRNGRVYISKEGIEACKPQLAEYTEYETKLAQKLEELRKQNMRVHEELMVARERMGLIYTLSASLVKYAKLVAIDLKAEIDEFENVILSTPGASLLDIVDDFGITRERGRQKLQRLCRKLESGELLKDSVELKRQRDEALAEITRMKNVTTVTNAPERNHLSDVFYTPVRELGLSVRAMNVLKLNDIVTILDIVKLTRVDLIKMHNAGRKTLFEIEDYLAQYGLHLGMTTKDIENYSLIHE